MKENKTNLNKRNKYFLYKTGLIITKLFGQISARGLTPSWKSWDLGIELWGLM
jgi:hypothetical protein